ncbi:MAG TPA: ABC transporter ATP-binding protein [Terriglobales bacterium]|nr:ABC transporter ATP-binding protein [Terriglobales bacterium]
MSAPNPAVTPLVEVAGVTKRFGPVVAVEDASFSIRHGEILGLIGPNGSGKTTLLECMGGVLAADSGAIVRDGRPLTPDERSALLFYLPDAIAPWPSQPLAWALDYTMDIFGGRRPLREDVLRALELGPLLDRPLGRLSKGQRKRALLAIGLLTPQPLLVADEPFEGLDLRQARDLARKLRAFAGGDRAMLLSIHQIADAARVCDRFVLISAGSVCGEGTLAELCALAAARGAAPAGPGLEEVFLGLT